MGALLEGLGSLGGAAAYLVVGALAALEASAFVGLLVPGELAMLVGGYITYQGRASLIPMMIFATIGAVVGDSAGYEIGRHLGHSIRRGKLGERVGAERWARAEHYLVTHGGRAVFLGRFIGVLRALVPALAGASRMRYRKFLFWNALGALVWAPSFVFLGYVAGSSYRRVEHYAGRAGFVLLGLVIVVGLIGALGHWISRNPERVRGFVQRQADRPIPARVRRRYHAQLNFAAGRLRPGQALGLALTLQLIGLGLAGWAFGTVVRVVVSGKATRMDLPITRTLLDHRVAWLTSTFRGVSELGSVAFLAAAAIVVGLLARRSTRSWLPLVILGAALVGGVIIADAVKPLVGRVRPPMGTPLAAHSGYAFPSGHATQAIALYGGLAYLTAGWLRSWSAKVAVWTLAVVLALLVGFSRVYLGIHWTTDVLGGYALGAVWLAAVLVTTSVVQGARRRHRTAHAHAPAPATTSGPR